VLSGRRRRGHQPLGREGGAVIGRRYHPAHLAARARPRRRRRVVARGMALVFAGSAMAVAGWPVGAGADAPEASGYWTKAQASGAPVTVPGSPTVPSGGLTVANDPSGPTAISAVRYPVAEGAGGTLVLA